MSIPAKKLRRKQQTNKQKLNSHYENTAIQIYKNSPTKKIEYFQIKTDIFHISAQKVDCGYSLLEYPKSMFLSRKKKNNVYPCKPQFDYIKVGFKGISII